MKKLLNLLTIFTLTQIFSINLAQAELADKDKPVQFESNTASYDDIKQVYQLNGKVIITKGTIIIKTENANIKNTPEGYQYAVATGGEKGLAYVRQKREGLNEFFEGYGNKLEYNSQLDTIKFTGNARIIRLDDKNHIIDEIKAPKMLYNGRNETYHAIGDASSNGRVKAIITPKNGSSQSEINTTGKNKEK
jgi:lipopolysaccharide export system protein LptA